mgnify:CR=1 FL=1
MPSFDTVMEPDFVEVKNAIDQAAKEIGNRFDFKGSDARVEINEKEKTLTAFGDDDFKLSQVRDVLTGRLAKRNIDVRCLQLEKIETIGGGKVKQIIKVREGVDQDAEILAFVDRADREQIVSVDQHRQRVWHRREIGRVDTRSHDCNALARYAQLAHQIARIERAMDPPLV